MRSKFLALLQNSINFYVSNVTYVLCNEIWLTFSNPSLEHETTIHNCNLKVQLHLYVFKTCGQVSLIITIVTGVFGRVQGLTVQSRSPATISMSNCTTLISVCAL